MGDKPWKAFERRVAALLGGRRHWANSGEKVDVTSDFFVVQCKEVATMSLTELTGLAVEADRQGRERGKVGIVAVKLRAGRGRPTPGLFVFSDVAAVPVEPKT